MARDDFYDLPHLHTAYAVDKAILHEKDRLVFVRFGKAGHRDCLAMDSALAAVGDVMAQHAIIYAVDIEEVPEFNRLYCLTDDPMSLMCFYKGRKMQIDMEQGCNFKICSPITKRQSLIDVIEVTYEAALKGHGVVYVKHLV